MNMLKKCFFILVVLVFYNNTFAQNPNIVQTNNFIEDQPDEWNTNSILVQELQTQQIIEQQAWNFLGDSMVYAVPVPTGGNVPPQLQDQTAVATRTFNTLSNNEKLYLRFQQTWKNFQAITRVRVTDVDNNKSKTFDLNTIVGSGYSTATFEPVALNISEILTPNTATIQVEFLVTGYGERWVIRGLELWKYYPVVTVPIYLGDTLSNFGYEVAVDDAGGVFKPNELIISYDADATDADKQALRKKFNISDKNIRKCLCGDDGPELWVLDSDTQGEDGIIDINKIKGSVESESEDELDNIPGFNYYTYSDIVDTPVGDTCEVQNLFNKLAPSTPEDVVIAVLDSGVEFCHPDLKKYIWKNNPVAGECDEAVKIGWDFVDDDDKPYDLHCHGTHVSGIIANTMEECKLNCNFRVMPLRTHDSNGVSNLFDVMCAIRYAVSEEVDIINASWGYVAESDFLLRSEIQHAQDKNVLFITSSGNEGEDLATYRQIPAVIDLDNIITVGSVKDSSGITVKSGFSNYSPQEVDIAAFGENVISSMPGGLSGDKSGTSMAAPFITAKAAVFMCNGKTDVPTIRTSLLKCADNVSGLNTFMNGNVINLTCAKEDKKGKIPWWIYTLALVVLLLTVFFVRRRLNT